MSKSVIYNLNGDLYCQVEPTKSVITEQLSCSGQMGIM
jgi:hypothetical protein